MTTWETLDALKRSRSAYLGRISTLKGHLEAFRVENTEDISRLEPEEIDRIFETATSTKSKFQHSLEAAQEFAPVESSEYDSFQEDEENAQDRCDQNFASLQRLTNGLKAMKLTQLDLGELTDAINNLEDALATKPDGDHTGALVDVKTIHVSLKQEWNKTNLSRRHPTKGEIDDCSRRINALGAEVCGAKHRVAPASTTPAAPVTSRPERKLTKLPTIELPTFRGDVLAWPTFWNQFVALVDSNPDLPDSSKLSYLRQAIKDPEAAVILNPSIDGPDTYGRLIKELQLRYRRTKRIHRNLVEKLVQLPPAKYTSSDLRKLVDTTTNSIECLQTTGYFSMETFLASLTYSKLPYKLQVDWDKDQPDTNTVMPYSKLLEYVSKTAFTLSDHSTSQKPQPTTAKGNNQSRRKETSKGSQPVNVVNPAPSRPPYECKFECKLCAPEKHNLHSCPKWATLTLSQKTAHIARYNCCSNCLKIGHTTTNCHSSFRCNTCSQKHHSTIHPPAESSPPVNTITPGKQVPDVLLTTTELMVLGPNGEEMMVRALIDSGAGISLVTSKVTELLNLPLETTTLRLTVAQGAVTKPLKYLTTLTIAPIHNRGLKMTCAPAVTDTVTAIIPAQPLSEVTKMQHLRGLTLADTTYNVPSAINIILGADMLPSILSEGRTRKGKLTEPVVIETIFGWTLAGPVPGFTRSIDVVPTYCMLPRIQCEPTPPHEPTLDKLLQAILHEEEDPKERKSNNQEVAERHFRATTKYLANEQRYEVSLPKKDNIGQLGESRPQAVARYLHTTIAAGRKNIQQQFHDGIASYIQLGHAEEVPPEAQPPPNAFWLPMHSVLKLSSSSTKLRIVFDGSAATTSGLSLNQTLHVGPTIQATLSDTLMKFRTYPIALNADISKMYREVKLCQEDKDLHRFVWQENPTSQIKDYRMTRVTFGVSASPFLAIRTLHQVAADHGGDYPEATQHIRDSFYVDDFLGGANNLEEATQLYHDLRTILQKGGFELRKWRSSSANVLSNIPADLQEVDPLKTSTATHVSTHSKALELRWDSASDVMSPTISATKLLHKTRRGLVSAVFRTYDVLGWIAPTVLQMKLLIQGLWKSTKGWDDVVPDKVIKAYLNWERELPVLAERSIPRTYTDANPTNISLHGFADASKAAYGAVVYYRATYNYRTPTVSLVTSKTRLVKQATTKQQTKDSEEEETDEEPDTIPKLELCAALLLAKLLSKVGNVLKINPSQWHAWSDASTVVAWLDGNKRDHPVYVANRVKKTLKLTQPKHWLHVPGEDNPADCASRGVSPTTLANLTLWWEGPAWLQQEPISTPPQPPRKPLPEAGLPIMVATPYHSMADDISNLPLTYPHLVATTAWCLRFCDRIKLGRPNPDSRTKHLTGLERREAEKWLMREAQRRCFPDDLQRLSKKEQPSKDSRLKALKPFLDADNIIRVGGRLSNSAIPTSQSKPIIGDAKDTLMIKLLEHLHLTLLHCGPSHLLAYSGNKHHIIGARKLTRKICRDCVTCRTYNPRTQQQLMANLPSERVNASPPFTYCGMDFAGPFETKMGYVRKPTILKAHICIFICLSTKAIHLEVTTEQSTEAFEKALQRFIARRGCPRHLYSDNGGGFIGAKNRYHQLLSILKDQKGEDNIRHFLATQHSVIWHNIPAFSPHMGGLWEAGVKSMKRHLRRVMGTRRLTFEDLTTVTCRIEACLNSRPLIPITSPDPDGVEALTASHFLLNKAPTICPDEPNPLTERQLLQKWNICQGVVQQVWSRWHKEYLRTLQARTKWQHGSPNLKVEDIVAIRPGGKILPCHWPLGKVVQVIPGNDGRVRCVVVKTKTGLRQRAVTQLSLIYRPEDADLPRPWNLSSQDSPELEEDP